LLATAGNQDLVRAIGKSVIALELVDDRLFQRNRSIDGRVVGITFLNSFNAGIPDVLGSVEIGFTGAESNHVPSGGTKLAS